MIPQEYYFKVKKSFNNDAKKAWTWFYVHNHYLGNSPIQLIREGNGTVVMKFIDDGNLK